MFCCRNIKKSCEFFIFIRLRIVLLEYNISYTVVYKNIKIEKEMIMKKSCIFITINRTIN